MSDKNIENNRPTSPHIQIYKWNICSLTSIMHRMSGIIQYLSMIVVSWYIAIFTYNYDAAGGVYECDCVIWQYFEYLAGAATIALIVAVSYHSLNGIRHLFWDIGKGFELPVARFTGYLVIISAIIIATLLLGTLYYSKFV